MHVMFLPLFVMNECMHDHYENDSRILYHLL